MGVSCPPALERSRQAVQNVSHHNRQPVHRPCGGDAAARVARQPPLGLSRTGCRPSHRRTRHTRSCSRWRGRRRPGRSPRRRSRTCCRRWSPSRRHRTPSTQKQWPPATLAASASSSSPSGGLRSSSVRSNPLALAAARNSSTLMDVSLSRSSGSAGRYDAPCSSGAWPPARPTPPRPRSPSSLRAACGAPRARETRASPRKWRGRAGSHASLQLFASYEKVELTYISLAQMYVNSTKPQLARF